MPRNTKTGRTEQKAKERGKKELQPKNKALASKPKTKKTSRGK